MLHRCLPRLVDWFFTVGRTWGEVQPGGIDRREPPPTAPSKGTLPEVLAV